MAEGMSDGGNRKRLPLDKCSQLSLKYTSRSGQRKDFVPLARAYISFTLASAICMVGLWVKAISTNEESCVSSKRFHHSGSGHEPFSNSWESMALTKESSRVTSVMGSWSLFK